MTVKHDPEDDSRLLHALLCDEAWRTDAAALKARALEAFRTRQRTRRLTRWASGVTGVVLLVSATWWLGRPVFAPHPELALKTSPLISPPLTPPLSDAELLAVFPPGSCLLAEIDGQKQLVFLDPEVERVYLAKP